MAAFEAGQIVIAEWRDAVAKETDKLRPAVVVEDDILFGPGYPAVILVPLTEHSEFGIRDLSLRIEPTPENGCSKPCYAISHFVTATAVERVRATPSRITAEQLARIRRQVADAVGVG